MSKSVRVPAGNLKVYLPTCSVMMALWSVMQIFEGSVDVASDGGSAPSSAHFEFPSDSRHSNVAPLAYVVVLAKARCRINPSFTTAVEIGHSANQHK
jgi:hypothetical protein